MPAENQRGVRFTKRSAIEIGEVVRAARGGHRVQPPVRFPRETSRGASYTWAYVFNSTASGVVPQYGVMELIGLENTWNGGKLLDAQARDTPLPVFHGVVPWTEANTTIGLDYTRRFFYGVALHEIPPQTIGRVAVSGIVPARVKANNTLDRLAGPCVGIADGAAGYASTIQLESGWGPVEIVDLLPPQDAGDESPVVFVRLGGRPFRCLAASGSDSTAVGNARSYPVRIGLVGNTGSTERNLTNASGSTVYVRVTAAYGPIPTSSRLLVEQQNDGGFAAISFAPA